MKPGTLITCVTMVTVWRQLHAVSLTDNRTIGQWVKWKLSEKSDYNSKIRPGADTGNLTDVEMQLYITTISELAQTRMDYTVDMFLRQYWYDRRLSHNFTQELTLDYNHHNHLWVPDLYFYNAKQAKAHKVTVPNIFYKIQEDGMVLYSQRISGVFSCFMQLHRYPMDTQHCHIRIESYAYTTKELDLRWRNDDAIDAMENIKMPEFQLEQYTAQGCPAHVGEYATGAYPCLQAQLVFKRRVGIYLVNTYIPSILSVMMSWVSFWIDALAVPARTTIGLLTVLTVVTQTTYLLSTLPSVSYVKAVDVWMVACLLFVFAAFLEFAAVNVLNQKRERALSKFKEEQKRKSTWANLAQVMLGTTSKDNNKDTETHNQSNGSAIYSVNNANHVGFPAKRRARAEQITPRDTQDSSRDTNDSQTSSAISMTSSDIPPSFSRPFWDGARVDQISRVLFPLVFAIFTIGYWISYLYLPDEIVMSSM